MNTINVENATALLCFLIGAVSSCLTVKSFNQMNVRVSLCGTGLARKPVALFVSVPQGSDGSKFYPIFLPSALSSTQSRCVHKGKLDDCLELHFLQWKQDAGQMSQKKESWISKLACRCFMHNINSVSMKPPVDLLTSFDDLDKPNTQIKGICIGEDLFYRGLLSASFHCLGQIYPC